MKNSTLKPIFPYFCVLALLSASPAAHAAPLAAQQASTTRATALCTDLRLQTISTNSAASTETTYTGQELVTQEGDTVTVEYLPDRLTGFAGNVISYERITRDDASQLGFKIDTGMALYMLHGDEELPSEYVLVPEHMAGLLSAHFQGLYGTCDEEGQYDASHATRMSCVLK